MERIFDAGLLLKEVQKSKGDREAADVWYYYNWIRLCDGRKADGHTVHLMARNVRPVSKEEWERPMRQR